MYVLSRMMGGNMEEFRKKKLSRVVFLVKLNENSDPTLRDRRGAGNGKFRPVFFSLFFFSTHRCFSARHENSHCAFSPLFVRANVKGGWVFTGQRAVEIRDREEEEERRRGAVKCHGDYLMSDVIVKTVEP